MSDLASSLTAGPTNASPVFRLGRETVVNEHTSSRQDQPQIVGLADGRLLFTFTSQDPTDGDDFVNGVSGRIGTVHEDGSLSFGDEFRINDGIYGPQLEARVIQLSDGRLLFVYTSHDAQAGDESVFGVLARVGTLEQDGTITLGSEVLVNEYTINFQDQPRISELNDGRIVFVFDTSSLANGEEWSGVAGRIGTIDDDGTILFGDEFRVNDNVEWHQGDAQILQLSDGRILATYFSGDGWVDSRNGPSLGIYARIGVANELGSISFGDEFRINEITSGDQTEPQILQLLDGRILFLMVSDDPGVGNRIVARIGTPMPDGSLELGSEIDVNEIVGGLQGPPQVIQLADHRVLFTYSVDASTNDYYYDVAARLGTLEPDGSITFSEEFAINRYTSGGQDEPQVTQLSDGRVLFAFTTSADEANNDQSITNIGARVLDFSGIGTDEGETLVAVAGGGSLFGLGGNDELVGSAGDDWFDGGAGDDRFSGGAGDDRFNGGSGDDRFDSGAGSDFLNGGDGLDTVTYSVLYDYFDRMRDPVNFDHWHVTESDGSIDTLTEIERIELLDGALLLDLSGPNVDVTYRIYSASFARTPDEEGLRFWTGVMDYLETAQPEMDRQLFLARQFLNADEYTDRYGPLPTNTEYVRDLYINVLGRLPDHEGNDFWVGAMEQGMGRDELLIQFAECIENVEKTDPFLDNGVWVI